MRVILVPVADRPECKVALGAACDLASRLSANVVGCHVRPHREEGGRSPAARFRLVADDTEPPGSERGQKDTDLKRKAARALFVKLAEKHGFELRRHPKPGATSIAVWEEMVGTPAKILSIVGPVADLVVVSRPKRSKRKGPGRAFLLAALLQGGKPVLVLPERGVRGVGTRVLIAWNQSVEAARALAAAIPVLTKAESVHFVAAGPENRPGPKMRAAQDYLAHWGIASERTATKGRDPAAEIEAVYRDVDADLLVTGAYSRGRIREIIFGGVTEHMLFDTKIPVFALHD